MCDRDTRKVTLSLVSRQEEILPWRHFYSNFCSAKAHSTEFTIFTIFSSTVLWYHAYLCCLPAYGHVDVLLPASDDLIALADSQD